MKGRKRTVVMMIIRYVRMYVGTVPEGVLPN
jgi:hypothetical protein